jgi:hypothetical protein
MTEARYAPVLTEAIIRERAAALLKKPDTRIMLLRAQPRWSGPPEIQIGEHTVKVTAGISQLAVLDAYSRLGEDEYLIVLTDRFDQELGSAVRIPADRQTVQTVDEASLVPALFGVTEVDPRLRTVGLWLPGALLEHRPPQGWPTVPAGTLTAEFAVRALLEQVLGLPVTGTIDSLLLLEQLDGRAARRRWIALEEATRAGLTAAVGRYLGDVAPLALTAISAGTGVSVIAIGLVTDVLWPSVNLAAGSVDQVAARARLERVVGAGITPSSARSYADAAVSILLRRDAADDPITTQIIAQAEALLADQGWAAGATESLVLTAGLRQRLRTVAIQIAGYLREATAASAEAIEQALTAVGSHLLAHRATDEIFAAHMAVRLIRWLNAGNTGVEAGTFSGSLERYLADGGWADRALAAVWKGSSDPEVAAAYSSLVTRVRAVRDSQDMQTASTLTGDAPVNAAVIPVEAMLQRVVYPLAQASPVLLIVLDGMSVAVATELAQDIAPTGWVELVPEETGRRTVALAALPTVTTYSRTSLFAGRLLAGQQDTEKTQFAAAIKGVLFHKNDLRAEGGVLLPVPVTTSIADRRQRVVGVVLNTIDDALAKHDPGGTRWTLPQIQHLRALLNEAALAGRVVILTSDHGHVIERGGEHRPMAGAGARWRSVDSGALASDEVIVTGSRVLAPGGTAILASAEGVRYTAKAAGYHGGASAAELTVPVLVFRRQEQPSVTGWVDAVPQTPVWWNEASRTVSSVPLTAVAAKPTKKTVEAPSQIAFDLEVPADHTPVGLSLTRRVIESEIFEGQQLRAGRGALNSAVVAAMLDQLLGHDGRVHKDTIAAAAGIAANAIDPTLAMLRRLLNVEGYEVVATDTDGKTVLLDSSLLSEQFGLGQSA